MAVLQLNHLSYQLDTGEVLFNDISANLDGGVIGLVGNNGAGKSLLLSILAEHIKPSSGSLSVTPSLAYFQQSAPESSSQTVADFLGAGRVLRAIEKITAGSTEPCWFDRVGDQWHLTETLPRILHSLGLPDDPFIHCAELSGGQAAKLRLWHALNQKAQLTLLDEPTNHLDSDARTWLREALSKHSGAVIVASHDRELLRHVDQIWELSNGTLCRYGGNYDAYREVKSQQLASTQQKIKTLHRQQKHVQRNAQRNTEKAQQRSAQGNKIMARGGQPKVLLNAMRDNATASASNRKSNTEQRQKILNHKIGELKKSVAIEKPQHWKLASTTLRNKCLFRLENAVLARGIQTPINLTMSSTSKILLTGNNGTGKTTLLRTLMSDIPLTSGKLHSNSDYFYLDQHYSEFNVNSSSLSYLMERCQNLSSTDARTSLANIGLRGDAVYRPVGLLSGGEKVKLAILIANHQHTPQVLLLDEPDNHLDIEAKQRLAAALKAYPSGFVMISHDKDFIVDSGVTDFVELK